CSQELQFRPKMLPLRLICLPNLSAQMKPACSMQFSSQVCATFPPLPSRHNFPCTRAMRLTLQDSVMAFTHLAGLAGLNRFEWKKSHRQTRIPQRWNPHNPSLFFLISRKSLFSLGSNIPARPCSPKKKLTTFPKKKTSL